MKYGTCWLANSLSDWITGTDDLACRRMPDPMIIGCDAKSASDGFNLDLDPVCVWMIGHKDMPVMRWAIVRDCFYTPETVRRKWICISLADSSQSCTLTLTDRLHALGSILKSARAMVVMRDETRWNRTVATRQKDSRWWPFLTLGPLDRKQLKHDLVERIERKKASVQLGDKCGLHL